ncbi:MAG: glycosyltransferase [Cyclobacteriaceae bacterium]
MASVKYSVVIPVYNRPEEIAELLSSLVSQHYKDFEVIIVEDGSNITCKEVFESYADKLKIRYFFKPNSGPGPSRNFGFSHAIGEYFVVFDSDCLLPANYFAQVENFMKREKVDMWGGPDRGHDDFTVKQRAMAYTMSSTFTTGGIRGGMKRIDSFQPRSFNMGMSREVFERTGGFVFDRFAEDIELSLRVKKMGFGVVLIPDAFVYHKRRTSFSQFYRQVSNFGRGRVLVGRAHREAVKLVHWFPSLFTIGVLSFPVWLLFEMRLGLVLGFSYLAYLLVVGVDAFRVTSSAGVAFMAVPSALVQLFGYGLGFIKEKLRIS